MTQPFGIIPSGSVPEPGLTHATDHEARAIGVLISQFRDKPRFEELISIYAKVFQELEDVFWDLYTKRRLDNAQGVQLDLIGKIVDEARDGLGDDDYRAVIRIKIRVLFSRGTSPDLIKICQLFLQSNLFTYQEFYPAAIEITVLDLSIRPHVVLLRKFLQRAKSGGVRLDVVEGTGGLAARFHYGTEGTGSGYGNSSYGGVI